MSGMRRLSQRARCRGLNIFEFIGLLLISGGLGYGLMRGLDAGLWEGFKGALLGAGVGWLSYVVMMLLIMVPLWAFFAFYRPQFPRCSAGRCKDTHYRHLGQDEMPELRAKLAASGKEIWLVRCGCGTLYCSSLTEQRFYEVTGEGELRPFMRHRPYRRWEPDAG
jgi:hypothetical protein